MRTPWLLGGASRALDNALAATEAIRTDVRERVALSEAPRLQVLEPAECRRLLAQQEVGRLAYVARAGTPDIVPVNYSVVGGDLLIRSGVGPKLQAVQRRDLVALEVDDLDSSTRSGWSVVVVGRVRELPARALDAAVGPHPWADGPRERLVLLQVQRLTGRRLLPEQG